MNACSPPSDPCGPPRPRSAPALWAMVADLEGSRDLADRPAFAADLRRALARIRRPSTAGPEGTGPTDPGAARVLDHPDAGSAWVAPLEAVRGLDELSGVARRPGPALRAAFHLTLALWPHRFRFALARGRLDVGVAGGRASAMDGPAFHRAADALERARRDDLPCAFAVPEWPAAATAGLESSLRLHFLWVADWTARQAEVYRLWRALGVQRDVAERLDVTPSNVSMTLDRAHAHELAANERSFPALLDWLDALAPAP